MAQSTGIFATEWTASNEPARHVHDRSCRPSEESDDPPMTIGEVAREFGMTPRALRFYEAKRLISPERHGTARFYRRNDRERLILIITGRRLGFTLAEIRDFVGRSGGGRLHLTREKCIEQITLLERQKRNIDTAIAELRQIYTSFYKALLDRSDQLSR